MTRRRLAAGCLKGIFRGVAVGIIAVATTTFSLAAASSATGAPSPPLVLGPAESRLQLTQISSLIAGQYDNEPQRHYLEGMKRGASAPARLHLQVRSLADRPLGFTIEERDGNEHQSVARRGTLVLAADPLSREIVMTLEGSACRWRWGWVNGLWRASVVASCPSAGGTLPIIAGKTWWLGKDELWIERPGESVMIELGRTICSARAPKCGSCVIADLCPRIGVGKKRR